MVILSTCDLKKGSVGSVRCGHNVTGENAGMPRVGGKPFSANCSVAIQMVCLQSAWI